MLIGFYFRKNLALLSVQGKNFLKATFLPVIDYGDILYMHASPSILWSLDSVYHTSLHCITYVKFLTHHCILYNWMGWTSMTTHRKQHGYIYFLSINDSG